jgi:putative ABC transport system permease protein
MSGMRTFWRRFFALFRRRGLDRELDEELRIHLEMAAEEYRRRGMAPEEAWRKALRDFGGVTQVRETVREREGVLWLENLRRDGGYALRQMRKNPGFATVVVVTLALGIGATTAIFTLVYSTLVRALPYPQADRIVAIHDVRLQGASSGGLMGVPRFFDVRARSQSFESLAFFFFDQGTLMEGTKLPVAVQAARTNAGFWDVMGVRPILGRTYGSNDDRPNMPPAMVLSYTGWQRIFGGDPGVVGRQVTLDETAGTILGVMPRGFDAPSGIDLWRTAQLDAADWTKYRGEGTRFINVFGRLRPGVTLGMAQADLERIGEQLRREHPDSDGVWGITSRTLRENRYGPMRPALLVLLIASALLLLIACINVANLLLSRATARQREVALRRALGASAGRMTMQFLTESAVLGVAGGAVGVAAAFALVKGVAAKLPGKLGIPGTVEMSWPVVAVAALVAVGTGIAFGIVPAMENRRVQLNIAMKQGEARLGGSGHKLRSALVSVQVGLSLILLAGASLLAESLWHLVKNPLGFAPDHLLTFSVVLPWDTKVPEVRNFFADVQRRLEAQPGVTAAGQMNALPTVDWHRRSNFDADWLPRIANQPPINAEDRTVGGNILDALGVPLVAGRAFTDHDSLTTNAPVLVNQELVRQYLAGANPLGRHLLVDGAPHEIVGVIANLRGTAGSIASTPGPEVYWPADQPSESAHQRFFVVRSQGDPESLVRAVRELVHAVDPRQAIGNVATMDQLLDKAVAQPRLNVAVVASFAGIALLLACVGIYGVVAFFVAQRTQEIGVRMALGATRREIALLFVKRAVVPAAVGLLAGTCVAVGLAQLLKSQLYGVKASDPLVFLASIVALLVPVVMATLRPAWAAASVNPVEALRTE